MSKKDVYFAQDSAEVLVSYLQRRSEMWFETLVSNDYIEKIKRSWAAYHGNYYRYSHGVSFGGESGELVNLPVNHFGNIAQNILTMVTATRPSFQARAVNTDLKSQIQTNLASGLLEYYMREKRLEQDLKKAVEYAIVMGSGYIKMDWNATSGEIYDTIPAETEIDQETGEEKVLQEGYPIYEGDVEFTVLSPFDVVFDTTKEGPKQDWQLCRTFKNKYDLAAKYPQFEDEIKGLQTKSEYAEYRISLTPFEQTVDVPVYEFFHRPTESLPHGRYCLYLDKNIVLEDSILPYKRLPIFRIAPRDLLGTPYGYTNMWDLLPIQEMVNSLYSTVATNNHTFGVQNIYAERDSGITFTQLSGGLNLIEGNPGSNPPSSLQLTQSSPETYSLIQQLVKEMETISGVNAVARGNPDPKQNLRSGNALALIQSQALQFVSGLQQSYIQLIEDVGTNLIMLLQVFASVPRIAQIAGKSNATYMKEFTGEDLNSITRVIVDAGNALAQTTAGRVEIASQLMQMGAIKTPEEYISVINTGKLEAMTESQNKQLLLVRAENERLIDGQSPVMAVMTDDHSLHLREHQAVLADPDLRLDQQLVQRALDHIQEHINILSDPNVANILMSLGQQPIAPMMPPQGQGGGEGGAPPAAASSQAGSPQGVLANPQAQNVSVQQQAGDMAPNPATPPAPFEEAPTTGAQQFNNLVGSKG